MNAQHFEETLARLYTDQKFREEFLTDGERTLAGINLNADERHALLTIDRIGLMMAARSFQRKREMRGQLKSAPGIKSLWNKFRHR